MRTHGNLTRWNDDRGFGFITTAKGEEIFVHISAFPREGRPQVGELVSFETEVDKKNRTRAIRVMRPAKKPAAKPAHAKQRHRDSRRFFGKSLPYLVVAGLAAYGYSRYVSYTDLASHAPPASLTGDSSVERATISPEFKCDGRQHCSEMHSCEEARFFVAKCSGVKMDGDGDGKPCEDWCGH